MALSLSLVYIPIPRLPDVPKSAIFSSKLTWSVYSGMDIVAKSIGCLWALGITSVSIIMVCCQIWPSRAHHVYLEVGQCWCTAG